MRGWITRTEGPQWLGPFFQTPEPWWPQPEWKGRGKGGAVRPPTVWAILEMLPSEHDWRSLQLDPAGPRSLSGQELLNIPISVLAWELASHPDPDVEYVAHGRRVDRQYHEHRRMYCMRYFVDNQAEVLALLGSTMSQNPLRFSCHPPLPPRVRGKDGFAEVRVFPQGDASVHISIMPFQCEPVPCPRHR